jgi:hypothetical protein
VFLIGMEDGVLPHANNDDVEEERRVAYVGLTRAMRLLGLTFAARRFGQSCTPSQFLYEMVGREKRHCVWTDAHQRGADENLPLLTDRERLRLRQRSLSAPSGSRSQDRSTKHSDREPSRGHAARESNGQTPVGRNDAKARPSRHGMPWNTNEDDRLRAAFAAGEAIAAIAAAHERRVSAITSRLIRLGLITEDGIVQAG